MVKEILKNRPSDDNFHLDDYPLYNLNRTAATYAMKMTEVLKSVNIDQSRWRVLMLLGDKNPSTVSNLSRRSVTKLSTITRIVMRLEQKGLVTRSVCPEDSRVTQVHITDEGRRTLESLRDIATRIFERSFTGIDEEQAEQFLFTLKKIRSNLADEPA